jgi:hypothetical protein
MIFKTNLLPDVTPDADRRINGDSALLQVILKYLQFVFSYLFRFKIEYRHNTLTSNAFKLLVEKGVMGKGVAPVVFE